MGIELHGNLVSTESRQQITPDMKFTCDGMITKWIITAFAQSEENLRPELQVWRKIGNDTYQKINGTFIEPATLDDQLTITISLPTDNQLCFNEGDEFGFSSSSLSVLLENGNSGLVYVPSPSNDDTCQNLNDVHTTALPDGPGLLPLMAIRIGKTQIIMECILLL